MSVDVNALAKAIAAAAEEYERRYGHAPGKARVTLSKQQNTAASGLEVYGQLTAETKDARAAQVASLVAAAETATSRALAEELATKLREYNPGLTSAQALARVYEANPQLYQSELSASDLASRRQTQIDFDSRRFA